LCLHCPKKIALVGTTIRPNPEHFLLLLLLLLLHLQLELIIIIIIIMRWRSGRVGQVLGAGGGE
jgi:hypothetical protein